MKKQILSLMFTAAIFTTTPLLAMDERDDAPKGSFRVLSDDVTLEVIGNLPTRDVLALGTTSKAMKDLCETSSVWTNIAKRDSIALISEESPKDQVVGFFRLFRDPTSPQRVSISQLISWKRTPFPEPISSASYRSSASYHVTIGGRRFQMINTQSGPDRLELLAPSACATFVWTQDEGRWNAPARVCCDLDKTKGVEFGTPEYAQVCDEAFVANVAPVINNQFTVREIKEATAVEKN